MFKVAKLKNNNIYIIMEIKPVKDFWYKVKNETERDIQNNFNVQIFRNNKDLKMYYGEWVKLIKNDHITHIVKPTETLEVIAQNYNTSKQKIVLDNALENERLFIGQSLKITNK